MIHVSIAGTHVCIATSVVKIRMQINGRGIDIDATMDALGLESGMVISNNRVARCLWPENHGSGDSNPSFSVSLESGAWICYAGCGAGSLIQLVKRLRNLSDKSAKLWLLTQAGKEITFDHVLSAMTKPIVDQYIPDEDSIRLAQADYDLMDEDTMSEYFFDRGFNVGTVRKWGIRYDVLLKAIVIPIYSADNSRIIGTVKRLVPPVPKGISKYRYNAGFQRKFHLFGANKHMKDGRATIVVEGPLDAIWLHQCGFDNTVSLLGSYCSEDQIRILKQLGNKLILALDNDEAGREATVRIVEKLKNFFIIQVVPMYNASDVQELSELELREVIGSAAYTWRNV